MTPEEFNELEDYEIAFERIFCLRVTWDGDCWIWNGDTRGKDGYMYGALKVGGRKMSAHRFAYAFFNGPIESGMLIHHLCERTLCVNPQHLRQIDGIEHAAIHAERPSVHRRWKTIGLQSSYPLLTDRQLEVLTLCGEGRSTRAIAEKLGLSIKCVEFHKTRIRKLVNAHV